MRYFKSIDSYTGALHQQPRSEATRPDWYFDKNYEYQSTGFIDAPDITPSGSVKAMDCETLTLGIAYTRRS